MAKACLGPRTQPSGVSLSSAMLCAAARGARRDETASRTVLGMARDTWSLFRDLIVSEYKYKQRWSVGAAI